MFTPSMIDQNDKLRKELTKVKRQNQVLMKKNQSTQKQKKYRKKM